MTSQLTPTERRFPVQHDCPEAPKDISWVEAEAAYEDYCAAFYGWNPKSGHQASASQSLERLAERGGFGWKEMQHFKHLRKQRWGEA